MLSNLMMILVPVILIVSYRYSSRTRYKRLAECSLYLSILFLFIIIATNLSMIISPFTPKYHGRVIDADTKKPLAGINVKAGWHVRSVSVGGSSGEYHKIYKTRTDANGNFVIPRGLKALTIYTPVSKTSFDAVILTIYPADYEYQVDRTHYVDGNESTIALKKINTDKEFMDNILYYYNGLFLMHKGVGSEITDPQEINWIKNAYYQFERIYPDSSADEAYLQKLVSVLDKLKQPDCLYLLNKLIAKYPDKVTYSKGYIELLKQEYGPN